MLHGRPRSLKELSQITQNYLSSWKLKRQGKNAWLNIKKKNKMLEL